MTPPPDPTPPGTGGWPASKRVVLRTMQASGLLLAVVMVIVMAAVPATEATHVVWAVIAAAGLGMFAGARWLDER